MLFSAFCCLLVLFSALQCFFCFFVLVKSYRKKNKKNFKTGLITSIIILLISDIYFPKQVSVAAFKNILHLCNKISLSVFTLLKKFFKMFITAQLANSCPFSLCSWHVNDSNEFGMGSNFWR